MQALRQINWQTKWPILMHLSLLKVSWRAILRWTGLIIGISISVIYLVNLQSLTTKTGR